MSTQPSDRIETDTLGIGSGGDRSYLYGNETIEFEHGPHSFTVYLITNHDRLLCPMDRCSQRFASDHALHKHLYVKHGLERRQQQECEHVGCDRCFDPYKGRREKYCCGQCAYRERNGEEKCCVCGHITDPESMTFLADDRGANTRRMMCEYCVDDGWLRIKRKQQSSDPPEH